ncbi:hypothetical protein Tco_0432150 [Tanacetum coccineum]
MIEVVNDVGNVVVNDVGNVVVIDMVNDVVVNEVVIDVMVMDEVSGMWMVLDQQAAMVQCIYLMRNRRPVFWKLAMQDVDARLMVSRSII